MLDKYAEKYNYKRFTLAKENSIFKIYLIDEGNNVSILISPESNFFIYSTKLDLDKTINKNKVSLDILNCFNENKVSIYEVKDSEIIITFELEDIYENLFLLKLAEKDKYIYSIKIKKNKYNILWKDPNFGPKKKISFTLDMRIKFAIEKANMNIFCKHSMEEALKFVVKRIAEKDNLIFISNIGLAKSGKRFIEIVRKIYGFDIMVLFYSKNKTHFEWIKDFPNCLYAESKKFFEEYLTNYNIEGLNNIKIKIEKEYDFHLKEFSYDCLNTPFTNIINQNYKRYIRHVKIFSKNNKGYLCMTKIENKIKVIFKEEDGEDCLWDITLLDEKTCEGNTIKTITLYSNNFYLKEENKEAIGSPYMVKWEYKIANDLYYFICLEKTHKNILSVKDKEVIIDKNNYGENELFQLIDVDELENDISSSLSDLSKKIGDETGSIKITDSNNISISSNSSTNTFFNIFNNQ